MNKRKPAYRRQVQHCVKSIKTHFTLNVVKHLLDMHTKIFSTSFIVFLVFSSSVIAQSNSDDITKKFFEIFEDEPLQAIDYAFSTNTWMERNVDGVENLKSQFKNLMPLIGDYYGFELITEKHITDRLVLKSFLLRYDRQPMRFTFILYKPKDKWQFQNFNYDDNLDDELKESANQSFN